MLIGLLFAMLQAQPAPPEVPAQNGLGIRRAPPRTAGSFPCLGARIRALCAPEVREPGADRAATSALIDRIADSGRCVTLAESPDSRTSLRPAIAPGQPPVLSFRYYEGKLHHRFEGVDLMLDDAGH